MDFIIGFLSLRGKIVIMVVVDRLSKYGHFIALPSNFSSETVVSAFVSENIHLHKIHYTIVTGRDLYCMQEFWQELYQLQVYEIGNYYTISPTNG